MTTGRFTTRQKRLHLAKHWPYAGRLVTLVFFMNAHINRRKFLVATGAVISASALPGHALDRKNNQEIIDLHQHTNYSGRNDERLLRHQRHWASIGPCYCQLAASSA